MTAGVEIQLIAVIVSAACALPGVFLVLRKMSMMSDSITHTILLGIVLAFAPFDRMVVFGVDIGAKAIYTSGALLLINVILITMFYKELKIVTFDPMLASLLGFSPGLVHYGLMTLVSLTAVGAFEAVGSVLVVAFMIGPPLTAYMLTDDLKKMLLLSAGFGALSGILGYHAALLPDVSIAGSMAVTTGLVFAVVFIFAPKRGLIGVFIRKIKRDNFMRS